MSPCETPKERADRLYRDLVTAFSLLRVVVAALDAKDEHDESATVDVAIASIRRVYEALDGAEVHPAQGSGVRAA